MALTKYFKHLAPHSSDEGSDPNSSGPDSSAYEDNEEEVVYWSRVKSRAKITNKKYAVYSLGDDLKFNNQNLKKMRGSSTEHDAFIFDPNSVNKVGYKWDSKDFELDQQELRRWG